MREVLKITLSIGGDEICHFLEWVDFSGNSVQPRPAPWAAANGLRAWSMFRAHIFPVYTNSAFRVLNNVALDTRNVENASILRSE